MSSENRRQTRALLISVFLIATCGLIYELLAGTIASYLLGDSVTQFSTVIGVYLSAMGLGSWLSKFVRRDLIQSFIRVEILVGLIGGATSIALFLAFAELRLFRPVLYGQVLLVGTLVGLEIPLLMRILEDEMDFKDLVSEVLALDYLGALVASLLFPLWLVPKVGLMRSSFVFGLLNVAVALWACYMLRERLPRPRRIFTEASIAFLLLLAGAIFSQQLMSFSEQRLYDKEAVILARSSPYQRVVVTRARDRELKLYLSGELQLSSLDEYRYHEALVHPGLAASASPRRVLVLGGGDGMAVREVLKDERVETVLLVDLDPLMTEIFRDHETFAALNDFALRSPKVKIVNADAFVWLNETQEEPFDFIVLDFPDPTNFSIGKLYTTTFYHRLLKHLAPDGIIAAQSTSPLITRKAFWCVVETVRSVGMQIRPYHAPVPTFSEWGFVLAARDPVALTHEYPPGLRYLDAATAEDLFDFPLDMAPVPVEVNRLDNQILVHYHRENGLLAYDSAPNVSSPERNSG